ncbi:MAG TPA: FtsQ-type POTRA domain-containing protein [Ruminococcus sp.]|nr:FtsQ-type POTRA domain-containing protein [Ruminococcus sp.]
MKDVEKTTVERQNSRKRIRRRRRWNNLYVLAVVLLVVTAGITICHTFLFNLKKIRVSGESDMYSAEEIVQASGIKEGDNLLRLDTAKSEQAILDKLLYVETASVEKKYPTSLEIRVTKCIPAFNVVYDGGTLLVSKKGKILADNGAGTSYMSNGLPIIYGYEPADLTAGKAIETENEHKSEAFQELIKSITEKKDSGIATLDMSDEFNIIVNYQNGMIFKMGSWNDVEYKLSLASSIMEDETVKGKKGYLTMVGTNQCSFRMTDDIAAPGGKAEPQKPKPTDANGDPSGEVSEYDPGQVAGFDRANEDQTEPTQEQQDDQSQDNGQYSGWDDGSANYDWNSGQDSNNWDNGGGWNGGDYQDYNDYAQY